MDLQRRLRRRKRRLAKEGSRWMIQIVGMTADGTPTIPTTVIYRADKNDALWPAFNPYRGNTALPKLK